MEEHNVTITIVKKEEEPTFFIRHRAVIQIGVSVVVIAVAVVGVVTSPDPWSIRDLYIAIMSAVISLWVPSPKITGEK
jgi:hypothetical protein